MVVLLVAHDVDHLVDRIVAEAHRGRTDILRHIDRGAIATDQELLVEALLREVCPYRSVLFLEEESALQSVHHLALAHEVGLRLIIDLVEGHAQGFVGLVEARIDPAVHLLPQVADLLVALLPLHEHLVGLLDERSLLLGLLLGLVGTHAASLILGLELSHLLAIVLVEEHVEVADQVVALLVGRLGRDAVAPLLPGQHRLADMDATVVDDIGLDHAVAIGLEDARQRPSEEVVAHVSQVEGLVGVGR